MRPSTSEPIFRCATCEFVVGPRPVFHLGLAFCCAGCAADGPCTCSYDIDDVLAPRARPAASHPVADRSDLLVAAGR